MSFSSASVKKSGAPSQAAAAMPKRGAPKDDDANTAKKSKTSIEDGELATMWIKYNMQDLAQQWNSVGCEIEDEYSMSYQGGGEQHEYLSDMLSILKTGSCSYENPFGEDDREGFAAKFRNQLKLQERKFFFELSSKSLKNKKPIEMSDIQAFLIHGPYYPVHVSLKKKKKEQFENGSERFPFSSVHVARDRYDSYRKVDPMKHYGYDGPILQVECGPDCTLKECYFPGCKRTICDDHGHGYGNEDNQGEGGRPEIVYYSCECLGCDKLACRVHERLYFRDCDVCRNGFKAEANLGAHNGSFAACFKLCPDCGQECGKEEDGWPCEFYCCPDCLNDHRCHYDPTQFC